MSVISYQDKGPRASEEEEAVFEAFTFAIRGLNTDASRATGLAFTPRKGDIFIVTPPKCGTTMVQQACSMNRFIVPLHRVLTTSGVGTGACIHVRTATDQTYLMDW